MRLEQPDTFGGRSAFHSAGYIHTRQRQGLVHGAIIPANLHTVDCKWRAIEKHLVILEGDEQLRHVSRNSCDMRSVSQSHRFRQRHEGSAVIHRIDGPEQFRSEREDIADENVDVRGACSG